LLVVRGLKIAINVGKNLMERTSFENLRVYQLSEEIADLTWEIVVKWKRLAQDTVGKQLIKSADSIGANIAEGTGRGSYADNRRFARIARGSLFEVKHWLRRAYRRDLLTENEVSKLQNLINELTPKLSAYINSIGNKKDKSNKKS
jgi:four helix bundle protein